MFPSTPTFLKDVFFDGKKKRVKQKNDNGHTFFQLRIPITFFRERNVDCFILTAI